MDAETAHRLFTYNPDTGVLTRVERTSNHAKAGQVVGSRKTSGHLGTQYKGKAYLVHRIVWLLQTGEWPVYDIDHINGEPADNRWCNLRDVPTRTNMENIRSPYRNNSTGFLGVSRLNGKFHAKLKVAGKAVHLGDYATPEEAHQVYLAAKRELHAGCTI